MFTDRQWCRAKFITRGGAQAEGSEKLDNGPIFVVTSAAAIFIVVLIVVY